MKYFSTNQQSAPASFKEAVLNGLAPDGGLYLPESVPALPAGFLSSNNLSLQETGAEVAKNFIGDEIGRNDLESIIGSSLNFIIPVFPLEENIFVMELFHGPTLAFKDVGARFMAGILSHFAKQEDRGITILTATSGDTGSAVANAFYEKEGIRVVILYPQSGVSPVQEKQMTTLGKNISALSVDGSFDDCQRLVKKAFADPELCGRLSLTSANSINIARLLPQSFYYLYACSWLNKHSGRILFSVPSGNFGNLTAGIIAKKMGMHAGFLAATNGNDAVPEFLRTGSYTPRASVKTISNAMDVGSPSNFVRLLELHDHSVNEMRKDICGRSVSETETKETIRSVFREKKYLLDPHGAVGYCALSSSLSLSKGEPSAGVVLCTAHPAKFREVVEKITGEKLFLPEKLKLAAEKEKSAVMMTADFKVLKEILLSRYCQKREAVPNNK